MCLCRSVTKPGDSTDRSRLRHLPPPAHAGHRFVGGNFLMDIFILAFRHCTPWPTAASPPVELLFSSDLLDANDSCATFLGWSSCWPHRSGVWHCYATILLSTPGHTRHLPPRRSISSLVAFGLPPALLAIAATCGHVLRRLDLEIRKQFPTVNRPDPIIPSLYSHHTFPPLHLVYLV